MCVDRYFQGKNTLSQNWTYKTDLYQCNVVYVGYALWIAMQDKQTEDICVAWLITLRINEMLARQKPIIIHMI